MINKTKQRTRSGVSSFKWFFIILLLFRFAKTFLKVNPQRNIVFRNGSQSILFPAKNNISKIIEKSGEKNNPLGKKNMETLQTNEDQQEVAKKGLNSLDKLFTSKIGILKIKQFGRKKHKNKKHHKKKHRKSSISRVPQINNLKKSKQKKKLLSNQSSEIIKKDNPKLIKADLAKLKRISKLREELRRAELKKRANLISDRALINLINQKKISNDLFNDGTRKKKFKVTILNKYNPPKNSIESENMFNRRSQSFERKIENLDRKIQNLDFKSFKRNLDLKKMVDDESKVYHCVFLQNIQIFFNLIMYEIIIIYIITD